MGSQLLLANECRLSKVASPKFLGQNDVVNALCGADNAKPFHARTLLRDSIDLEFDGLRELYTTIQYRRYAYTTDLAGCDPLLSS